MQTYILNQGSDTRTAGRKCYLKIKTTLQSLQGYTILLSIDRTDWKKNLGTIVLNKKTLNQIAIGDNLRNKTLLFDTTFDVATYLKTNVTTRPNFGSLYVNNESGYNGLCISLFGYQDSGGVPIVGQLGFGAPTTTPPVITSGIWADTTGWKGTTYTFPDDKDYIVTEGNIYDIPLARAIRVKDEVQPELLLEFYITAEESALMSEGLHETCITVIDAYDNKQTIKGDLLIDVRRAENND